MSFLYLSKPSRIKLEDLFSYGLDIFGIFSGTNTFFKNTSAMNYPPYTTPRCSVTSIVDKYLVSYFTGRFYSTY